MKLSGKYGWLFASLLLVAVCNASPLYALDVTLRYGHSPGTNLTYQFLINTPAPHNSQQVSMEVVRHITNVDGSGVMEIHTSLNNGIVTIDSVASSMGISGEIMTTLMTTRGVVNETTATGDLSTLFAQAGVSTSSSSPDLFTSLGILEFPTEVVHEGSTWSVDKNHTFANGDSLNITYNYTLESFVSHGGYQCARILITAHPQFSFYQDMPHLLQGIQINGELNINGVLLFAYTEGRIVRLDQTITANQIGITIGYNGMAQIIPSYRQTTISVEIQ